MRILVFFGDQLGASRGTPSRARNMASALAAKPGVEVLAVSRDVDLSVPGLAHCSLRTRSLGDSVADFRPDVLYGHTHKALPHLAPIRGALKVVDLHGDSVAEKLEETNRPLLRRWRSAARLRWIEVRHLRRMDGCTTVGRLLARRAAARNIPSRVIWGGVDPGLFTPAAHDPGSDLVVGYAGNFRPYQGLDLLLEAVEGLEAAGVGLRLILIGDPGSSGLDERAGRILGDRVRLMGPLPYGEVPRALARANVLVIPRPMSRTASAGFPSKLPEYMALGKALVVTDVGDQAEVIRDGRSGLVVPPGDASALRAALSRLRDPDLRATLGANARRIAEEDLDWGTVTDRVLEFFHTLRPGPESSERSSTASTTR